METTVMGLYRDYRVHICCGDNGKENGNYRDYRVYNRGYIGDNGRLRINSFYCHYNGFITLQPLEGPWRGYVSGVCNYFH